MYVSKTKNLKIRSTQTNCVSQNKFIPRETQENDETDETEETEETEEIDDTENIEEAQETDTETKISSPTPRRKNKTDQIPTKRKRICFEKTIKAFLDTLKNFNDVLGAKKINSSSTQQQAKDSF